MSGRVPDVQAPLLDVEHIFYSVNPAKSRQIPPSAAKSRQNASKRAKIDGQGAQMCMAGSCLEGQ